MKLGNVCIGRGEANTEFWWGNMWVRYHLGDTGVDRRIILNMDIQEVGYGWGMYGLDRAVSG